MSLNRNLKIACYGKSDRRKTQIISHLIALVGKDNVRIISAEDGLGTIESHITDEMIWRVTNIQDTRNAHKLAREWASPGRWICCDGTSQIMEWFANREFAGADKYYEFKARGETIPDDLKPYGRYISKEGSIDGMRIYGRIGTDAENFLSSWMSLPCNKYFNYLEDMTESDGYRKMPPWGPDVPGKKGLKAIVGAFDYLIRLDYDQDRNLVAYLKSSGNHMVRSREDQALVNLPDSIVGFNLAEFVKIVSSRPAVADKEVVNDGQQLGSSPEDNRRAAKDNRGARSDAGVPQGRGV